LLMIFFILMYTISNVNSKKFAQLSASLSEALVGNNSGFFMGEAPGPVQIDGKVVTPGSATEQKAMEDAKKQIEGMLKEKGVDGKVDVSFEERGLVVSLKETLLFARGSAEINPASREVIKKIGEVLVKMPNAIRIEGHTCDLPIKTVHFPSNWELSTTRATNVVKFLIAEVNFPPKRLSATGYAETRPLVPNTTEANRQKNRRVDIVVLKTIYRNVEPNQQNQ
ncbi:MAG: OmpA family protein, partial [Bacillota bacterium]